MKDRIVKTLVNKSDVFTFPFPFLSPQRTEGFQTDGNDINEQFESLNDEFGHFISEFSIWGRDKEQELKDEIKKLYKKLADLADQLAKLQKTLLALGFGLGAGLTIGGIALALSGPAAPFILVSTEEMSSLRYVPSIM